MIKKNNCSIILALAIFLFFSCEKNETVEGVGSYALAINNAKQSALQLNIFIDDEFKEVFTVKPGRANHISDCDDLNKPDKTMNNYIISSIASGNHKIEIKDNDGAVLKSLNFTIGNKTCVLQKVDFN
ncbi:hypothetical protein [Pedobacter montanisoli]|uniref:Lipoprotein n=1 Tax=Pedobacter montanisoli TaxID=2923277 RepID=A0ABS9ZZJ3_9SPHI|nr:hypothetical protein [Pedobacter montanisoli]MCJ0743736.1 hypothetical protein [Pedobacter montanisoli]